MVEQYCKALDSIVLFLHGIEVSCHENYECCAWLDVLLRDRNPLLVAVYALSKRRI
jgi:hypothetical protein